MCFCVNGDWVKMRLQQFMNKNSDNGYENIAIILANINGLPPLSSPFIRSHPDNRRIRPNEAQK